MEESPLKRKRLSNNFEKNPVSTLFANPKGYAPLADRPETHLKVTKRSENGQNERKNSNLSAKVDEEVFLPKSFAKPMNLNPVAMASVDHVTKYLY